MILLHGNTRLAFPNNGVKCGFLESMMTEYVSDCGSGIDVFTLRRYINRGNAGYGQKRSASNRKSAQ